MFSQHQITCSQQGDLWVLNDGRVLFRFIPANQYEDQLQRDCCLDGIRETPLSYSCERRSEYIGDEAACVEAFLHCCKEMENQRAEVKERNLRLALSKGGNIWKTCPSRRLLLVKYLHYCNVCNDTLGEEDNSQLESDEIVSRTQFPASWLWTDVALPPCPVNQPAWWIHWHNRIIYLDFPLPGVKTLLSFLSPSTSVQRNIPLQDSITTWQFIGISLSRSLGEDSVVPTWPLTRQPEDGEPPASSSATVISCV